MSVCVLTAVEKKRWEWHGQRPSSCERGKHKHISDEEGRSLCTAGDARLVRIAGRWRLLMLNPKKLQQRASAGYTVMQLVDY